MLQPTSQPLTCFEAGQPIMTHFEMKTHENEPTMSESEEENAASTSSDEEVDFEDILVLQTDAVFPLGWRGLVR